MKVYTVRDHTGEETIHLATDFFAAVQAHLTHFGLLYMKEVKLVSVRELIDVKDRNSICWHTRCVLAGADSYKD